MPGRPCRVASPHDAESRSTPYGSMTAPRPGGGTPARRSTIRGAADLDSGRPAPRRPPPPAPRRADRCPRRRLSPRTPPVRRSRPGRPAPSSPGWRCPWCRRGRSWQVATTSAAGSGRRPRRRCGSHGSRLVIRTAPEAHTHTVTWADSVATSAIPASMTELPPSTTWPGSAAGTTEHRRTRPRRFRRGRRFRPRSGRPCADRLGLGVRATDRAGARPRSVPAPRSSPARWPARRSRSRRRSGCPRTSSPSGVRG
ncbi:hypothetical protein AHOG_15855 [Actinoalloteichus hoggarensis]|uniref:Uncharacterized protein n=1 Tax=Actinoalloteichus hoggarensis TaxID=1470176 RepID=A0A221W5K5_9PSEU|nr:hypothetical protein AHOG_15855 [Actinoalloteichus hoggarensis]